VECKVSLADGTYEFHPRLGSFRYLDDLSSSYGVENPKVLQGLVSFIQCFGGELPFFFLSGA
jgi:hypothetical protein